MSKKPKRLRNLRIKEISLCEQGMNPQSHIVLHKAADPAPGEFPSIAETAEVLKNANPEVLAIFKSQIEAHNRMLREFSIDKQEPNTMTDITKDYETLTNHYADKWDVTPDAAGVRLMRDRPDLVAKAYESSQAAYVQRQVDARDKVYPNG